MALNYIDLIAFLILLTYIYLGIRTGFWVLIARLLALAVSFYVAFVYYNPLGAYIDAHLSIPPTYGYIAAFIFLMVVIQEILYAVLRAIMKESPHVFTENNITRTLAIIPAAFEALILIVLLVIASTVLPLPTKVAQDISDSYTNMLVQRELPTVTAFLNRITGGNVDQAITLVTKDSDTEGTETLPFRPSGTSIDEVGEGEMLALVNQARAQAGVGPLTLDSTLTAIARAHSQDMWERQYFSHITPDGLSPFDRMHAAGITYTTAGENLALAPTVALAEIGLMNSPGHRANILDPNFHKVGIGIIDGGLYGKMVTQDFTN